MFFFLPPRNELSINGQQCKTARSKEDVDNIGGWLLERRERKVLRLN